LLCGIGLFIYQSLDAIDGKQARRTGSSTPLGELFDHGCDSVSTGKYPDPKNNFTIHFKVAGITRINYFGQFLSRYQRA
jgi:hypothetical protein